MAKPIDKRIIEAARVHFMTTGESLIDTAKHFGLTVSVIRSHAQKDKWNSSRSKIQGTLSNAEQLVSQRSIESMAERVQERVSSHLESMIEGSIKARKALLKNILDETSLPVIVEHQSYESALRSLDRLDTIARRSMGLDVQHIEVKGSLDVLSVLQSCQKLKEQGKIVDVDVAGLIEMADGCDKDGK